MGSVYRGINYDYFPKLTHITDVIKASCGIGYGLALSKNALYGWGPRININFKRKHPPTSHVSLEFDNVQNIMNVSAGFFDALILTKNGEIYVFNCINFTKVCTNMMNVVRIKCVNRIKCANSEAFIINNKMNIQILNLDNSQHQNIILCDDMSQLKTWYVDDTLQQYDEKNNVVPILIIFAVIVTIPLMMYMYRK